MRLAWGVWFVEAALIDAGKQGCQRQLMAAQVPLGNSYEFAAASAVKIPGRQLITAYSPPYHATLLYGGTVPPRQI